MNLLEIRTQAAKQSGRYDLVDPATFADNGMALHISSGQRYLNKKSEMPKAFAHLSSSIVDGDYYKDFGHSFEELDSVTVTETASATTWELTHKTLYELEAIHTAAVYSVPMYYAYASYRTLKTAGNQTEAEFVGMEWPEEDDDKYAYNGIIIIPHADQAYTVMAGGEFMPMILSGNTDTNFWSDEYPDLLILATLRSIAVLAGDYGRAAYIEAIIHEEIVQIGFFHQEERSQEDQVLDLSDRII